MPPTDTPPEQPASTPDTAPPAEPTPAPDTAPPAEPNTTNEPPPDQLASDGDEVVGGVEEGPNEG